MLVVNLKVFYLVSTVYSYDVVTQYYDMFFEICHKNKVVTTIIGITTQMRQRVGSCVSLTNNRKRGNYFCHNKGSTLFTICKDE